MSLSKPLPNIEKSYEKLLCGAQNKTILKRSLNVQLNDPIIFCVTTHRSDDFQLKVINTCS